MTQNSRRRVQATRKAVREGEAHCQEPTAIGKLANKTIPA